jgi:hypothetical protein
MKSHGRNHYLLVPVCLVVVLCACSLQIAGTGSGSEVEIKGALVSTEGTPAAGASVKLIPFDFRPHIDDASSIRNGSTDNSGRFVFDTVADGRYNIRAFYQSRAAQALVSDIVIAGQSVLVPTKTLQSPGRIILVLSDTAHADSGTVFIPGTDIYAGFIAATDTIILDSVPAGTIPRIVVETGRETRELTNTDVFSGRESVIELQSLFYKRQLRINTSSTGANVTENLYSFPLMIRLDSASLGTDIDTFFNVTSPDSTVRFISGSGTDLPYEIEHWDASAKQALIWVLVDTVYGNSASQILNMQWGARSSDAYGSRNLVFDTAQGYLGVWHMNTADGRYSDATAHGYAATPEGFSMPPVAITGPVGPFVDLDGIDDRLNAGAGPSPRMRDTLTISAWVKLHENSKDIYYRVLTNKERFEDSTGLEVEINPSHPLNSDTTVRESYLSLWGGSTKNPARAFDLTWEIDRWYHIALVMEYDSTRIYRDGVEVSVSTSQRDMTPVSASSLPLLLGGSTEGFLYGALDEIRIATTARRNAWVKLSYETQRAGQTCVTFE